MTTKDFKRLTKGVAILIRYILCVADKQAPFFKSIKWKI